jgi:phosphate-selective porin OprO/OprP
MVLNGLKGVRKYCVSACVVLAAAAGSARADDAAELRQLLDMQSRQIEQLKQRLDAQQQPVNAGADQVGDAGVKKIVDDYLKEKDVKKKADDAAAKAKADEEGFKVGSDLNMKARWRPDAGILFSTPNNDFTYHVGFRTQFDTVWWNQNRNITPQIGDLQDGSFFRRTRCNFDGTMYEVFEFNIELQLERIENGSLDYDDVWAGITKVPVIGSIRLGHMHLPHGLEADAWSSSKPETTVERSIAGETFFYDNLGDALLFTNSFFCQHMTYQAAIYRQDQDNIHGTNAINFGDGRFSNFVGRLTALPLYEDEGRHLLHLGASFTERKNPRPDPNNLALGTTSPGVQGGRDALEVGRYRVRELIRDFQGDFGSVVLSNGALTALPGNATRFIDTGSVTSPSETVIGTEFLYICGPLSFQSEWMWASLNDVPVTARGRTTKHDQWFNGGYFQVSYFLTGENRLYDQRLGRLGTAGVRPITPFWFVRGEHGPSWGLGALETFARWNQMDLSSRDVHAGQAQGVEVGVNWYLTTLLKMQFEYIHEDRFHMGGASGTNIGATGNGTGNIPGSVNGFVVQTQLFF